MKLLLDTHVFLWWLTDSPKLSAPARAAIAAPENDTLVSAVVGWECATKHRLGKLPEAEHFMTQADSVIRRAGMTPFALTLKHALRAGGYEVGHADPFDRMLAAQSELDNLTLVTRDPAFTQFPIRTLW
ncbi:MAG: type II toxin-antitoxin system VapC family toxin [Rhodocyclaceae bacterium]|nr:type II toxin-antitoxin system VapC family toxin [Rhodocyclaceae bacterium]